MGDVKATSSLDSRPFQDGLNKMDRGVNTLGSRIGKIGGTIAAAFSVGAIKGFATEGIRELKRVNDTALQLAVTVEELQGLEFLALKGGANKEAFVQALTLLEQRGEEAIANAGEQREAFERLGISTTDLATKTKVQLLEAMGRGVKASGDFAAVLDLLGTRAGRQLRPSLEILANEGFGSVIEAAREAGQIVEENITKKASEAGDEIDILKRRWSNFWGEIGTAAAGGVNDVVDALKRLQEKSDAALPATQRNMANAFFGMGNLGGMGGIAPNIPVDDKLNKNQIDAAIQASMMPPESAAGPLQKSEAEIRAMKMLQAQIDKLQEKIDDKRLTTIEKIALVEGEIAKTRAERARIDKDAEGADLLFLQNTKRGLELGYELLGLQKQLENEVAKSDKAESSIRVGGPISDAVSKIGGSLGGEANNRALGIAERQLSLQEQSKNIQQEIANNTKPIPGMVELPG